MASLQSFLSAAFQIPLLYCSHCRRAVPAAQNIPDTRMACLLNKWARQSGHLTVEYTDPVICSSVLSEYGVESETVVLSWPATGRQIPFRSAESRIAAAGGGSIRVLPTAAVSLSAPIIPLCHSWHAGALSVLSSGSAALRLSPLDAPLETLKRGGSVP